MIEDVRDKNPMTTLYCGMSASNSQIMFESMDAALNNGAEGVSIFTINGLRSPEIRAQFRAYADSARAARAARAASGANPEVPVTRVANANPFENTGIMKGVDMHILAYLSMANATTLPELEKTDQATIELVFNGSLRGNTAEDYLNRLKNASRRNQDLEPVARALSDQFTRDNKPAGLNLSEYVLVDEYGATKVYQVSEENSEVVFDVTFYFYGGIISGWSVKPETESFEGYKKRPAS
jgi:hypothetical protein